MQAKKTRKQRLDERNERIKKRFNYLFEEKGLRTEIVLSKLEEEFPPLLGTTIWLIVSETGYYKTA